MSENRIVKIIVKDLFGIYNYKIDSSKNQNLTILYGDNGCGKTTILEILYHLFAAKKYGGHRSYICNKKFSKFEVHTSNNTVIKLTRDLDLIGSYTGTITNEEKDINIVCEFIATGRPGRFTTKSKTSEERIMYDNFLQGIKDIDITVYMLSDDRKLHTSESTTDYDDDSFPNYPPFTEQENNPIDDKLKQAIMAATNWFQSQNFDASDESSVSMNGIYINILKNLNTKKREEKDIDIDKIKAELASLSEKSELPAAYGLMPKIDTEILSQTLDDTDKLNLRLAQQIINPYIFSMRAKIQKLQKITTLVDNFVTNLNEKFFTDKKVVFNIASGINIHNKKGEKLDIKYLSSGEKQLLLLLCNAIASRNKSGLLIIDEPELSLNIKWKRNLLKALLDCTDGSASSFMIATHSIELFTPYKEHLVKLESE